MRDFYCLPKLNVTRKCALGVVTVTCRGCACRDGCVDDRIRTVNVAGVPLKLTAWRHQICPQYVDPCANLPTWPRLDEGSEADRDTEDVP